MTDIMTLFSQFAFPIAVCIYLLWNDHKQNERYNNTVDKWHEANENNNAKWHEVIENNNEKWYSMLNENNSKWSELIQKNASAIQDLANKMQGIETELKEIRELRTKGDNK